MALSKSSMVRTTEPRVGEVANLSNDGGYAMILFYDNNNVEEWAVSQLEDISDYCSLCGRSIPFGEMMWMELDGSAQKHIRCILPSCAL